MAEGGEKWERAIGRVEEGLETAANELGAALPSASAQQTSVSVAARLVLRHRIIRLRLAVDAQKESAVRLARLETRDAAPRATPALIRRCVAVESEEPRTMQVHEKVTRQSGARRLKSVNKALDSVMNAYKRMGEMVAVHEEMFADIELHTVRAG